MIGKNRIYSLTSKRGFPEICFDLTNQIGFEDNQNIEINLPSGSVSLKKSVYINTQYTKDFKVYDNSEVFFIICTKHVMINYAFDVLMAYACKKIDNRINKLETLKEDYKKLIKSKQLVAA